MRWEIGTGSVAVKTKEFAQPCDARSLPETQIEALICGLIQETNLLAEHLMRIDCFSGRLTGLHTLTNRADDENPADADAPGKLGEFVPILKRMARLNADANRLATHFETVV